jgi:hypothetical protein
MAADSGRWTNRFLNGMREIGDPIADEAATAVLAGGHVAEANALLRTLVDVDQLAPKALPSELREYLEDTLALPKWADFDRIERAQRFFQMWGVQITACLFCASLPSSYAAAKGVKVLHMTARLDTDKRRRVFETGQFLMDVMAPNGLTVFGNGRRSAQRVRLMHAAIRCLIAARAEAAPREWKRSWGTPINQEDLAGTLLAFSHIPVEPLRRLGINADDRDEEDYLHAWNVVGSLLGVREDMLAKDVDDASTLVRAIRRRQFRSSPEGKEMTAALIELLGELTPGEFADRFIPTFIRHLIGNNTARMVGIPSGTPSVPKWMPRFVGRMIGRTETYIEQHGRLQTLMEPFARELLQSAFNHQRGGERAPFDIPTELAASWTLTP